MIGTESAVVGTAVLDGRVPLVRHLRRFEEDFPASLVIVDIVRHKDALESMTRTSLQQIDRAIFENNLRLYLAEASRADGGCGVVEDVRPDVVSHR